MRARLAGRPRADERDAASRRPDARAQRSTHQRKPDAVRGEPQRSIEVQPAERGQDELPVVAFDLGASASAEQHESERPRVGNVGCDVHEVLTAPPDADAHREAMALTEECGRKQQWQCALEQAAAERGHERTERHEEHVSRFVKDQIRQMPHRLKQGWLQAGAGESPGPPCERDEQRGVAPTLVTGHAGSARLIRPKRGLGARCFVSRCSRRASFREHDPAVRTFTRPGTGRALAVRALEPAHLRDIG